MPKDSTTSTKSKNKGSIRISRSRTATARMNNQLFHQNFDYLREITERCEIPTTSTGGKRGRGRPRGRGGLIGGGPISVGAVAETSTTIVTTRDVATLLRQQNRDEPIQVNICGAAPPATDWTIRTTFASRTSLQQDH